MRLDSALLKSRPRHISAQKISTLFDALDEREIARSFSDSRAFMAVPVSYYISTFYSTVWAIYKERSPNYGRNSNILIPDPYHQWLKFHAPEMIHRKPIHG